MFVGESLFGHGPSRQSSLGPFWARVRDEKCVHQCAQSGVELIENRRTVFLPMLRPSEARFTVPEGHAVEGYRG